MPKTNNAITTGWRGSFGKQVVFRQMNGKTISSAYPDMSDRVLSPKQQKINELMKKANHHASLIMEDEQSRHEAQVRLDVPRNKLYTALIKEYYKNNYKPDETNNPDNSATKQNYDFMKYLLQHTNKSIEDISRLANMPLHVVSTHQDILRKPEETDEELFKKFQESQAALL